MRYLPTMAPSWRRPGSRCCSGGSTPFFTGSAPHSRDRSPCPFRLAAANRGCVSGPGISRLEPGVDLRPGPRCSQRGKKVVRASSGEDDQVAALVIVPRRIRAINRRSTTWRNAARRAAIGPDLRRSDLDQDAGHRRSPVQVVAPAAQCYRSHASKPETKTHAGTRQVPGRSQAQERALARADGTDHFAAVAHDHLAARNRRHRPARACAKPS